MITLSTAELPHAPNIEKAVLSCIVNNQELFDQIPNLSADHFYFEGRPELFTTLQEEWKTHRRIDIPALALRIHNEGIMERIGGGAAFADLLTYQIPSHGFERHLQILNDYLGRRLAIKAALDLGNRAFQAETMDEVLQAASEPISAIFDAVTESKPPPSTRALIKAALQRYLDRCNGKASPFGYGTGIEEIDGPLYGLLHPGRVIAIGAYPSGGKSVIGSQILKNTASNGIPSLYLPLEMSQDDLIDRAVIQAACAPALAWQSPQEYAERMGKKGVTEAEKRAFQKAAEILWNSTFEIVKPPNKKLMTILSIIRRSVREKGTKVVALDFIQQVRVPEAKGNKEQTMEEISHSLQEIAEELQLCIIVLSQLNADGDTKHGRVVEEDADAFLQVVQEMDKTAENFKEHQYILVAKDRHYGQGGKRLPLILDKENIRFVHGIREPKKKKKANF
jgi:replicative DNA helicase